MQPSRIHVAVEVPSLTNEFTNLIQTNTQISSAAAQEHKISRLTLTKKQHGCIKCRVTRSERWIKSTEHERALYHNSKATFLCNKCRTNVMQKQATAEPIIDVMEEDIDAEEHSQLSQKSCKSFASRNAEG